MTDLVISDRQTRRDATSPDASFIVQAPAGSGKTSLLTQRFLRLLAHVERPEEIVAITFTRKAAGEMRHRVVSALATAEDPLPEGSGEHERLTRDLAVAALANGRRWGWDLQRQPSRLQIQTIDGLNHWLAARLPLTAKLGLSPGLLDDARPLYQEAASRFVQRLEEGDALAADIDRLARLLDHDVGTLQTLLANMLGRREVWLPKLLELSDGPRQRAGMERLLTAACEAGLARIRARLDVEPFRGIVNALRSAALRDPGGPLDVLARGDGLPPAQVESLEQWERIARSVLTGKGSVRRRLSKTEGFPPAFPAEKADFGERLAALATQPALVTTLATVLELPPPRYDDSQWARVAALIQALVPAAAELQAVFGERGLTDHAAVAAAARQALGDEESPSELALALDYRIRHLLVDEYQDTSPVQQQLLQRLVAGWQEGDGHTLFCVGDPMQSIYGFREADVTLFLEAQEQGVGGVRLERRSLTRNFRSCRSVVEWVNDSFSQLLPDLADYESGAVPFTPSASTREDEVGAGVTVHTVIGRDERSEAVAVVDAIDAALGEIEALESGERRPAVGGAAREIAVLERSRSGLPPLLAELRRRGIDYRGVELESLSQRPAVRDLLALARALLHPGDRTAWLAILRAPWCGLSLADLYAIAAPDRSGTILSRLQDPGIRLALSEDGRQRIERALPCLLSARADLGRAPLGSWVRACWLAAGGPATIDDQSDLDNAEACFSALDLLATEAGPMPGAVQIEDALEGLMASPTGNEKARVQLMTIHKAKGLEFDTVILPGLEKTTASDSRQLLYWAPVAVEGTERGIVLASRGDAGGGHRSDGLEAWMRRLEDERRRLELGRLAYVAATRARRKLHLVGAVGVSLDDDGGPVMIPAHKGSLLEFLWPVVRADFDAAFERMRVDGKLHADADRARPRRSAPVWKRLASDFSLPSAPPGIQVHALRRRPAVSEPIRPQFEWAGAVAIAVGTIVHGELERLGRQRLPAGALSSRPAAWKDALRRLGLPAARWQDAMDRIERAVEGIAGSELAARLLDPAAREGASELSLTAWLDGEFATVKIDRTFIDAEGTRWIVDWKTGAHEGTDVERFLSQEIGRYAPQLERYARVMSLYDPRPQRVGLYFPLLDRWQPLPGSG